MTATNISYQREFFTQLSDRFGKKGEMIQAMEEHLHVGQDAVYRRIRGETPLTADEMISLARRFNISLDRQQKKHIPRMYYPMGASEVTSEMDYFDTMLERCELLVNLPDVKVDYATPELPFFYEFAMPTLLAYRTYVYGLTTWDFDKWKGTKFSPGLIDPRVKPTADRILNIIYRFPGRELWSAGILDVTLRRIKHGVEVGYLDDPAMIDTIFKELEAIIQHMEAMTAAGKRFAVDGNFNDDSPGFQVFHNEMTNTNSIILVSSSVESAVYTAFINPNYLISTDKRVVSQTKTWFDNLASSSNSLNANSSKYTITFFNRLRKKVTDTKLQIEVLNEVI